MAFKVPVPVQSRRHTQYEHQYQNLQEKNLNSQEAELFCSKCIKTGKVAGAYGFCKVCADFLCEKCVTQHEGSLLTLNHGLITGAHMLERYRYAMRKDRLRSQSTYRSPLSMIADDKATIMYTDRSQTSSVKQDTSATEGQVVKEARVKLATDSLKCFICSCTVMSDGCIILADANNKNLKLFDKHFNSLSVFNMKREPWDTCASAEKNQYFFATESQTKGVHQFKAVNEIQYILTIKVNGDCFGVAAWKKGVAVSLKRDREFQIHLIDLYGNIHMRFKDGEPIKLRSPWYLASTKNMQNIIVSDTQAGTVTSLHVEGGVNFILNDRKEMRDPRNITSDETDNIYVIDYENDTVHQISERGHDTGVVLCRKDGLDAPSGLCYHGNTLYLQAKMDSNTLQVFHLV